MFQQLKLIMLFSTLLDKFNEPETLKMAKLGRELRGQGIDITDLSLGEPDFDTPIHIKNAAKKAIDENFSHYTPVVGYLDVREAVCTKLKRDNNLDYVPTQIIVSTGAKQSIANAVLAIVDVGDEVIAIAPGSFATRVMVSKDLIARKPKKLSYEQAAAIPIAFLTAEYALNHCARIRAGESILIHAASGGVGLAAMQLARLAGACVYASAGNEEKRAYVRQLGARHVSGSNGIRRAM